MLSPCRDLTPHAQWPCGSVLVAHITRIFADIYMGSHSDYFSNAENQSEHHITQRHSLGRSSGRVVPPKAHFLARLSDILSITNISLWAAW